MIKLILPRAYGEIKPLANHLGQPIHCVLPPKLKKRRRRPEMRPNSQERTIYHV